MNFKDIFKNWDLKDDKGLTVKKINGFTVKIERLPEPFESWERYNAMPLKTLQYVFYDFYGGILDLQMDHGEILNESAWDYKMVLLSGDETVKSKRINEKNIISVYLAFLSYAKNPKNFLR